MKSFSDQYCCIPPSKNSTDDQEGLRRVAFVGTPCQIKSVRRMQTLGLVPSDAIQLCLGLFCSGNFTFGEEQRATSRLGGFSWEDVHKVNIKDDFMVHLKSGEVKSVPWVTWSSCGAPPAATAGLLAEFADIAFGGIGAEEGWTTVVMRSPLGRAAFADAKG